MNGKRKTIVLGDKFRLSVDRDVLARVKLAKARLAEAQAKEEGSFWVEEKNDEE